jgi:hypothetical protein
VTGLTDATDPVGLTEEILKLKKKLKKMKLKAQLVINGKKLKDAMS